MQIETNKRPLNKRELFEKYGILLIITVLTISFTLINSVFISGANIINIIRQASTNIIMACGLTFVVVSGTMDASTGAQAGLVAMISGYLLSNGHSIALSISAAFGVAILFGSTNGFLIQKYELSPLIVTLATANLATGFASLITSGRAIYRLPPEFVAIGRGYVGFVPVPVIMMVFVVVLSAIVLSKTLFGRRTYAIGGNQDVARLAGIHLTKYRVIFYIINSTTAALGGIIFASRLASATPDIAVNVTMDILCATVIGGASLDGGKGTIIGSMLGAILLTIISNGLNINGVNTYWQMVVSALILIGVIIINSSKD